METSSKPPFWGSTFGFRCVQVEDVSYWKHFVEETSAACPKCLVLFEKKG